MYLDYEAQVALSKLRTALRFYARVDNYIFNDDGRGLTLPDQEAASVVQSDMGTIARQALGEGVEN